MSTNKEKVFKDLIGGYVAVFLKNTTPAEINEAGEPMMISGILGFVVDVDNGFVLLGEKVNEYNMLIDISDIGVIQLMNEEDIFKNQPPPMSPNEEMH